MSIFAQTFAQSKLQDYGIEPREPETVTRVQLKKQLPSNVKIGTVISELLITYFYSEINNCIEFSS